MVIHGPPLLANHGVSCPDSKSPLSSMLPHAIPADAANAAIPTHTFRVFMSSLPFVQVPVSPPDTFRKYQDRSLPERVAIFAIKIHRLRQEPLSRWKWRVYSTDKRGSSMLFRLGPVKSSGIKVDCATRIERPNHLPPVLSTATR